jgi:hypothetical protein
MERHICSKVLKVLRYSFLGRELSRFLFVVADSARIGSVAASGPAGSGWRRQKRYRAFNRRTGDDGVVHEFNCDSQAVVSRAGDLNWTISRTGDFDGDGKTDLIWRNSQTGDVVVWFMDGSTTRSWGRLLLV